MEDGMEFHALDNRRMASEAAARHLAHTLRRDLEARPSASLVVSGGSTPADCFRALSAIALPWERVAIVPSDERWVPPDHPDSNHRLVSEALTRDRAAKARLVSLFEDGQTAAEATRVIGDRLEAMPRPFSAVLLGMGEDGHFASLFPGARGLADGLDLNQPLPCLAISTEASPHSRMSLTLATLTDTADVVLLIFGDAKRSVFEAAAAGRGAYPVQALLNQDRAAVTVYWAP